MHNPSRPPTSSRKSMCRTKTATRKNTSREVENRSTRKVEENSFRAVANPYRLGVSRRNELWCSLSRTLIGHKLHLPLPVTRKLTRMAKNTRSFEFTQLRAYPNNSCAVACGGGVAFPLGCTSIA